MSVKPTVEPVKNGWHARSPEMNLAVFGATEEEARRLFREAVAKRQEILSRPESEWGKTLAEVSAGRGDA